MVNTTPNDTHCQLVNYSLSLGECFFKTVLDYDIKK